MEFGIKIWKSLYKGVNEFKRGSQPKNKDNNGNLLLSMNYLVAKVI
jgi:hypothetical protein